MNTTTNETGSKANVDVLQWGEEEEDVRYVASVVERVEQAGSRAATATAYARDSAEFLADLRGAATMMGLTMGGDADVVETLRNFLLASRDHEGEVSERIITAANGKSEEERKAARRRASQFSGRRGCLDSAVYWMLRGRDALAQHGAGEEKGR